MKNTRDSSVVHLFTITCVIRLVSFMLVTFKKFYDIHYQILRREITVCRFSLTEVSLIESNFPVHSLSNFLHLQFSKFPHEVRTRELRRIGSVSEGPSVHRTYPVKIVSVRWNSEPRQTKMSGKTSKMKKECWEDYGFPLELRLHSNFGDFRSWLIITSYDVIFPYQDS